MPRQRIRISYEAGSTVILIHLYRSDPILLIHYYGDKSDRLLEVSQAFVQEDEDLSYRALGLFCAFNVDYSDCVILSNCHSRNLELNTFDKRLGKLSGAFPVPM
jgi:predicted nucleic acid-binding protein